MQHGPIGRSVPLRCRQFKRPRASAVSQFSTRQRPCRCLAVKQAAAAAADGLSEDCRAAALGDIPHTVRCSIIWR
uniref:Uncharacterized protein n=1 Tax=Macrostomum lignano TaxID=282301 RepID=A0A1I8FLK4_9PLAT